MKEVQSSDWEVRWTSNFYFVVYFRRQAAALPSVISLRLKIFGSRIPVLPKGGGRCKLSSCDTAGFAITVVQRCKLQPDSVGRSWEEDQSSYSSYVTAVRPGLDKAAEIEERNFSTVAEPSLQNTHKRTEERKRTYVEHFAVIFIRCYEKSPSLYVCVCSRLCFLTREFYAFIDRNDSWHFTVLEMEY